MNLIKLSEQLKDVPDNYLAQEVQKPTGNYPAYLIISELSRRKRMRDGVAKPEPQTTVAEDLAGQGGLADTPQAMQSTAGMDVIGAEEPEEMPQMAGGGLVAFQRGGLASDPLWQLSMQNNPDVPVAPIAAGVPAAMSDIERYSRPLSDDRRRQIMEEEYARFGERVPFRREEEARRISAREQALEGERKSNVNMALMEAGLGMMASRAPRGIQGVAEGGLKGLSALRAGKQEIKKSEAYLDQARDNYARAQELYDEKKYAAGDRAVAAAERQQALGLAGAQARLGAISSGLGIQRGEEMFPIQRRAAELGVQLKEQTMPFEVEAASLKPALARSEINFRRDQGAYYRGRGGQGLKPASMGEVNTTYAVARDLLIRQGVNPASPGFEGRIDSLTNELLFRQGKIYIPMSPEAIAGRPGAAPGRPAPQPGAPVVIPFDASGQRVQ